MKKLDKIDTRAPKELDKKQIKEKTSEIVQEINELQNLLFAESKHALLVVLQGMDASGKDGTIRNVLGQLNPQGVLVKSFKAPTPEELSHDFLWRVQSHSPAKGMIQVFNRSHYEDILITRVHGWCDDALAKKRIAAINNYEQLLQDHNNTTILKFYLHISREEQEQRLSERLSDPSKMWKYNAKDEEEAKLWNDYMKMYEECFEACKEPEWIVVPADQNWFKEYVVASAVLDALKAMKMQYPSLPK